MRLSERQPLSIRQHTQKGNEAKSSLLRAHESTHVKATCVSSLQIFLLIHLDCARQQSLRSCDAAGGRSSRDRVKRHICLSLQQFATAHVRQQKLQQKVRSGEEAKMLVEQPAVLTSSESAPRDLTLTV